MGTVTIVFMRNEETKSDTVFMLVNKKPTLLSADLL